MIEWPDLTALWLSFKLATVTTVLLIVFTTPLAYWLARTQSKIKPLIETLVTLPIVLPPTVLGFYLLILLGPTGWLGSWWVSMTGSALTFSFTGLVIASMFYSLPLAKRGFLTASVLGFAHTLGEFGVVLMVGGNIPGETKVIAIEIFNQVERLNYETAHVLSAILLVLAFVMIFMMYYINHKGRRHE